VLVDPVLISPATGPVRTSEETQPRSSAPRATRRFIVFGKIVPAVAFAVLTARDIVNVVDDVAYVRSHMLPSTVLLTLADVLASVFSLIQVLLFLAHEPPSAKDNRIVMRALPIVATFLLPTLVTFAPAGPHLGHVPEHWDAEAAVVVLAAVSLGIWALLTLSTSFSLSPEVRRLAATGPYRLVRHPVYLAEVVTGFAIAVSAGELTLVVGALGLLVLQVIRLTAEEQLLAAHLPGYEALSRDTVYRLVPGVW